MEVIEVMECSGLIPVAVLEDKQDALPVAKALKEGDLLIMEITMRTKAALECMEEVCENFPDMLVGAGTVRSVEQASDAIKAGARFIVTPGFDETVVRWCLQKNIPIVPGCVTPTEIEMADKHGLDILKFFPANAYGGIHTIKALHGPYPTKRFIPTGGIDLSNIEDFANKPYILAIGGGFLCSSAAIAKKNFTEITATAKQAIAVLLGFELAHIGINTKDQKDATDAISVFDKVFGLGMHPEVCSDFCGNIIEAANGDRLGSKGYIAIGTNHIKRALYYLKKHGFKANSDTIKKQNGKTISVYLQEEVSGFAIHLLQK